MKLTLEHIQNIPALYAQETTEDPTVYLIITCMSSFWLITVYDPKQKMDFGFFQMLEGCGELGYVSFDELESLRYPVQYKPTKKPFSELKKEYNLD